MPGPRFFFLFLLLLDAVKINMPEDEGNFSLTWRWNPNVWGNLSCRQEFSGKYQMGCHRKTEGTCWKHQDLCSVGRRRGWKNLDDGAVAGPQGQDISPWTCFLCLPVGALSGDPREGISLSHTGWQRRGDHTDTMWPALMWRLVQMTNFTTVDCEGPSSWSSLIRPQVAHSRTSINMYKRNQRGWKHYVLFFGYRSP